MITLEPGHSRDYSDRGLVKAKLRDLTGAVADCSQAITFDPSNAIAYYLRGLAREKLGDIKGAKEDLALALKFHPSLPKPKVLETTP